jgi:hypothetical protein
MNPRTSVIRGSTPRKPCSTCSSLRRPKPPNSEADTHVIGASPSWADIRDPMVDMTRPPACPFIIILSKSKNRQTKTQDRTRHRAQPPPSSPDPSTSPHASQQKDQPTNSRYPNLSQSTHRPNHPQATRPASVKRYLVPQKNERKTSSSASCIFSSRAGKRHEMLVLRNSCTQDAALRTTNRKALASAPATSATMCPAMPGMGRESVRAGFESHRLRA